MDINVIRRILHYCINIKIFLINASLLNYTGTELSLFFCTEKNLLLEKNLLFYYGHKLKVYRKINRKVRKGVWVRGRALQPEGHFVDTLPLKNNYNCIAAIHLILKILLIIIRVEPDIRPFFISGQIPDIDIIRPDTGYWYYPARYPAI